MRRHLLWTTVLAALAFAMGCASAQGKLQTEYGREPIAFTPTGLEQAGLVSLWQYDLGPEHRRIKAWQKGSWRKMREAEKAEHDPPTFLQMLALGGPWDPYVEWLPWPRWLSGEEPDVELTGTYLYDKELIVTTSRNVLYCFDRETGAIKWVTQLPGTVRFAPTLFDNKFYAVSGNDLYIISQDGAFTAVGAFPFSVSRPLIVVDDYIYGIASNGYLHKVDRERLTSVWDSPFRTDSVIMDAPVLLESELIFGTADGRVYGVDRVIGGQRLSIMGLGPVSGAVVTDGRMLYFGTGDFYVYCYTGLGGLIWKTPVEGMMACAPVLAGEALYADVLTNGLVSLNKKDGAFRWRNIGANQFVSTDGSKVFAVGGSPEMLVADTSAGTRQTVIPVQTLVKAMKAMKRMGRSRLVFYVTKDGMVQWETGGGEELASGATNPEVPEETEAKEVIEFESSVGPMQVAVNPVFARKLRDLPEDQLVFAVSREGGVLILWKQKGQEEQAAGAARVYTTSGKPELWVMDAENGRILTRLDTSTYEFAPRNLSGDGLVFLASKDGKIACLRAK